MEEQAKSNNTPIVNDITKNNTKKKGKKKPVALTSIEQLESVTEKLLESLTAKNTTATIIHKYLMQNIEQFIAARVTKKKVYSALTTKFTIGSASAFNEIWDNVAREKGIAPRKKTTRKTTKAPTSEAPIKGQKPSPEITADTKKSNNTHMTSDTATNEDNDASILCDTLKKHLAMYRGNTAVKASTLCDKLTKQGWTKEHFITTLELTENKGQIRLDTTNTPDENCLPLSDGRHAKYIRPA